MHTAYSAVLTWYHEALLTCVLNGVHMSRLKDMLRDYVNWGFAITVAVSVALFASGPLKTLLGSGDTYHNSTRGGHRYARFAITDHL